MKKLILFSLFPILLGNNSPETGFYAYYTKIKTPEAWEEHSRTARHADLVVKLGEGEVVFHRSSSYLPYWKTGSGEWYFDEMVPRSGDGTKTRPDKNNIYSYVRLIHSNKDSIVVHWRYFPNYVLGNHAEPIGGNVGFDGVVHEYFTFYPDLNVKREIRKGTSKLDDWNDPMNRTIQDLILDMDGITVGETTKAMLKKAPQPPVPGSAVLETELMAEPAAIWHFDEGLLSRQYDSKDLCIESVSKETCVISGPKTVWKKGISGTALAFDGYNSKVAGPEIKMPEFGEDGGFTVESWVAPGAYSICRWTAIAHQSEWEADIRQNLYQMNDWGEMQLGEKLVRGYFLGIDEYGRPVVIMAIEDEIVQVTATNPIPLYQWSHVAFTYIDEGVLQLYVDGEISDFINFSGHLTPSQSPFIVGKNDESIGYVSQHVVRTYSTFPSPLGFEGLIDEVKVYSEPIWRENMRASYLNSRPADRQADMQPRTLPGETGPSDRFGARYANLKYHDLWDNMWREADHPDIVVKFDLMPTSVIFWRGNRSPGWVTETNKWISDQSSELTDWHWENKTEGAQSCCEHMSDYQARHSHVRIIENTDARVVVHWRYASVDVLYKHPNTCRNADDWGVWTDEYLTIYPDGVGVRTVDVHGDMDFYGGPEGGGIGFHDTQFLSEAGTYPEDNINPQSLTVVSHKDEISELDWSIEHPDGHFDAQAIWINLKSDYKVFEVFPPGTVVNVWAGGEKTSYSAYSAWNHYPVTQAPCDGRYSVAPDRTAHSALGAADNLMETGNMLLYGFTNQAAGSLIPLAKSWNNPPPVIKLTGAEYMGYNKGERAYQINAHNDQLTFELNASPNSPVHNPCFKLDGWDQYADVSIDGKSVTQSGVIRQGLVRGTDGQQDLVLWIMAGSNKNMSFAIEKSIKYSPDYDYKLRKSKPR